MTDRSFDTHFLPFSKHWPSTVMIAHFSASDQVKKTDANQQREDQVAIGLAQIGAVLAFIHDDMCNDSKAAGDVCGDRPGQNDPVG